MTHKEAATLEAAALTAWDEEFARAASEQDLRAHSLLEAHRDRLMRLDAALAEHIQSFEGESTRERDAAGERQRELDRRERELAQRCAETEAAAAKLSANQADHENAVQEMHRVHEEWLGDFRGRQAELDSLRRAMDERESTLDRRQHDLDRRDASHDRLADRVAAREQQLDEQLAKMREAQAAVDDAARKQSLEAAELRALRESLLRERGELTRGNDRVLAREEQARLLRRRIARELRAQRAAQMSEIARREAEILQLSAGEDARLKSQLAESHAERERLKEQLYRLEKRAADAEEALAVSQTATSREHEERQAELCKSRSAADDAQRRQRDLAAEYEKHAEELMRERDALVGELEAVRSAAAASDSVDRDALDRAGDEIEALRMQLTESRRECAASAERVRSIEARMAEAAANSEASDGDSDQEARLEMALDDIRQLKARNAELEQRLSRAPSAAAVSPGQDWESQKKRLIAQLESDFDESDPAERRDKLSVNEAIRATDRAVAERELEIEELKRLLEQQAGSIGEVAVGAAAFAQAFDQDEIILEERENLKRAQDEWREKLRKAEVDISLERAKLARERSELEDRLQRLETERSNHYGEAAPSEGDKSKKAGRRWLTRLGLKEGEE